MSPAPNTGEGGEGDRLPDLAPLMGMASGLWVSQTLSAAEEIGLFTFLSEEGGSSLAALTRGLGVPERPAEVLVTACVALGLLRWEDDRVVNTDLSEHYLVRGRDYYMGDYVRMLREFVYPGWMRIADAVRSDRPVRDESAPGKGIFAKENRPEFFWKGLRPLSSLTARALAEEVDLTSTASLLDVGGGGGAFAVELCRRNPGLSVTVYDLPHVCEHTREFLLSTDLRERVRVHPGDFFAEELPSGHDAILLSMILHDWDETTGRKLLDTCFQALPPDGLVVVSELLVDDDRSGPLDAALMSMNMLVGTPGRNYTTGEYRSWLTDAGFVGTEVVPFHGPGANGAVLARKP
ncbi:methyltransferase [Nocardiopsis valliformis]|uniref:methyltransferase n=1 Tax=Nocardiopsis valliformis TaxID=239974 RepID=UPI000346024C|nr:methyltransferase [Nocardiopsis valliformis]